MARGLNISAGQWSDKGRKPVNQDFHGILIPAEPQRSLKGITVALADGISSSAVSQVASESAVKSLLTDYYCTSDSWPVKTAAQRVIAATNSWLYAQTRQGPHRYDNDRGYVCTFSALILKSRAAHIFHIGDARIYRLDGGNLEQITTDHRIFNTPEEHYLSRALGAGDQVEIDYLMVAVAVDDTFVLATDGIHEHVPARSMARIIGEHAADLDAAAQAIGQEAYRRGSPDNLTVQIIRIEDRPDGDVTEVLGEASDRPLPPILEARTVFDGYRILRELHASSRSHVYLAEDTETATLVVLKTPSIDIGSDHAHLRRFAMEEWIARRIENAHVLKPFIPSRSRNYLYVATEFVDGQTLTQWMTDNPKPDLETVRGIAEQIARGLRAFHRLEMVHQDIRPDNIMIDRSGTIKIIDFGSTKVAGVAEASGDRNDILGTAQYTAPEYFLGEPGTSRSDLFSLGVITYQMLTGTLPYGAEVAKTRTKAQQRKLHYQSALDETRPIPTWIDGALRKALHPDPYQRYAELSEFIHDLRHPNPVYSVTGSPPLIERNPLLFWQLLSAGLALIVLMLLIKW